MATEAGELAATNRINGNTARDLIAARNPGSTIEVSFETSDGFRFVDVLTVGGVSIESKVGRTSLTADIRRQILKDKELIDSEVIRGATFEFSPSPITGQVGPTKELKKFLEDNGIKIIINE